MSDSKQYGPRPSIMADQGAVADNSPLTDHAVLDSSYLEFYHPLMMNMDMWLPSSDIANASSSLPSLTATSSCQMPSASFDAAATNNIATFIDQNLYGVGSASCLLPILWIFILIHTLSTGSLLFLPCLGPSQPSDNNTQLCS